MLAYSMVKNKSVQYQQSYIDGVIVSMLASSMAKQKYSLYSTKQSCIDGVIVSMIASSMVKPFWFDHTRGKHANYYTIYVALLVLYTFGLTILEVSMLTITPSM